MSSTEPVKIDDAMRAFFRQEVVPAGERLRAAGHGVPMQTDPELASYYVTRDPSQPLIFAAEEVQVERLADLWRRTGREELVPLAAHLQSLAGQLHTDEEDGDVSPFIYAMF
jgi:hypothetical protein